MDVVGIHITSKELERYQKLVQVLVKYGFTDLLATSRLKDYIPQAFLKKHAEVEHSLSLSTYERIRMVLEELGPTYIKLGQIISNREDLLPSKLLVELQKLQDSVSHIEGFDICEALKEHLEIEPDDVFETISKEPLATASISQVHRARLKTGEEVVLKVQRPNIQQMIEADILVMQKVARLFEKYNDQIARYHPTHLIESFERSIHEELQFQNEARNQKRFAKNFKGSPNLYVPKIHDQYSNKHIICMEYVDGIKVNNIEKLDEHNVDRKLLASVGIDLYLQQVLTHGFFHADPHPGNLFYLPKEEKVCFIDFGMMGYISPNQREVLDELLLNFMRKDIRKMINSIEDIAIQSRLPNKEKLEYQLTALMDKYGDASLDELDAEILLPEFKSILNENDVILPHYVYLLLRALVIIEAIGTKLDPNLNILKSIEPYIAEILIRHYSPKRMFKKGSERFFDLYDFVTHLPDDARDIIKKIKNGEIKIVHEISGLEQLDHTLGKASNRLVLAVIIAALSISSSLLVMADMPPKVYDVPLFGVLGFSVSGLLGIIVVISILKNRNF